MWDIEIINETNEEISGYEKLITTAATQALTHAPIAQGELCITIVCDKQMQELNSQHRGKNQTTDVLSFPQYEAHELPGLTYAPIGDIIISLPKTQAQATEYGHSIERELAFLTVHGTLHLLGHDHQTPEDEKVMIKLQKEIMTKISF